MYWMEGIGLPSLHQHFIFLHSHSRRIKFVDVVQLKEIKKYYNCIFSIECNLRKHGAVTNQFPSILFQRQENWLRNWIGWPAVWRKRQAKPTKKINFINLICWWRQLERPQFSLIQSKEIWLIEENWLPPCFLCLPSSINKEKIFHLLIGLPGGEEKKSIKWSCLHSFKRMPLHWLTFLPSAVFDFIHYSSLLN